MSYAYSAYIIDPNSDQKGTIAPLNKGALSLIKNTSSVSVYVHLLTMVDSDLGYVPANRREIAKATGLAESTVSKCVKHLKEIGLLTVFELWGNYNPGDKTYKFESQFGYRDRIGSAYIPHIEPLTMKEG